MIIMVLPVSAFSLPFGKKWQRIGWAIRYFRTYMSKQLEEEQESVQDGRAGSGTLVSNLVRASSESSSHSSAMKPLTEDEILRNIFVFNFAGHDTTAISLAYGMLLLVANPGVQDWVHEELHYYLGATKTFDYSETFPKLRRCLAVLVSRHSELSNDRAGRELIQL